MSPNNLVVTTSWDDGDPADLKVAELLSKYGVSGTFYVPLRNVEGRPVLNFQSLRSISKEFEIGAHTLDHIDLTTVSNAEAVRQVTDSKLVLEDALGSEVRGFCYPRGRYSNTVKEVVKKAGYSYARTVANFYVSAGKDPFLLPTTLQFYPHRRSVYLRNYVRGGSYIPRGTAFFASLAADTLGDRIKRLTDICAEQGHYLHIWGHSWEISEGDLWRELRGALSHISEMRCERTTNHEAARKLIL